MPFCFHKCHYCDFYSFVDSNDRREPFVARLVEEWRVFAASWSTDHITTVFVGGGTPTLLAPDLWRQILDVQQESLPALTEFTVEANPETVYAELLDVLAAGGVNRLSVGAQSFQPHLLATLERHHTPENVGRSIAAARRAGISNVNIDLIFAIPGQSLDEWISDLEQALALEPDHLSCYSLMYEPNTALTAKLQRGDFERADDGLEVAMYEHAITRLAACGYEHYEVSAWARPGHQCHHNLAYWTNRNWWPLGPSASGHVDGLRWRNVPRLGDYLKLSPWPPIDQVEQLAESGRIGEELMLRLRLRRGIARSELDQMLNRDPARESRLQAIEQQMDAGMLTITDERLQLTHAGLLLADDVLSALL